MPRPLDNWTRMTSEEIWNAAFLAGMEAQRKIDVEIALESKADGPYYIALDLAEKIAAAIERNQA